MASYLVHKTQVLSCEGENSVWEYILLPVDGAGFVVLEHDLSVNRKEGKNEEVW